MPAKGSYEDYLAQSVKMIRTGRFDEAIAAAKEALRLNPKSDVAWNNIGVSDISLHRFDEAQRSLEEALRLNPKMDLAKANLGWLAQERAAAVATPAPAPVPVPAPAPAGPAAGTAEYYLALSQWQFQGGRYQLCIDAAREAIKLNPRLAEAWNNVAVGYEALGQYDSAIENARNALAIKPDFELAKNNLKSALAKKAK